MEPRLAMEIMTEECHREMTFDGSVLVFFGVLPLKGDMTGEIRSFIENVPSRHKRKGGEITDENL